jgi:hypothetical protein
MFQQFKDWHKVLPSQQNRIVSLGLQFLFWFIIYFSSDWFIAEHGSLRSLFFKNIIMACLTAVLFNWQTCKSVFRRNNRADNQFL